MKHHEVPSFPHRLFRWFCKERMFEELEGDLEEKFLKNKENFGLRKARRTYNAEVLKMIRPTILKRSSSGPVYGVALLGNYSTVAFRTLSKNKLFSAINILGLAMSMAIGLLAIAFATEMYSYDTFHEKGDRIYRVTSLRKNINEAPNQYASASLVTAQRLHDFGGFEKIVPMFKGFYGDIRANDKIFQFQGLFVGSDFFDVFTFPLGYGNAASALSEPFSAVITEDFALKTFSKKDVVGETLVKNDITYTITGVARTPPKTSHIQFDILASIATLKSIPEYEYLDKWGTMWSTFTYVLMPENFDMDLVMKNLIQLESEENAKVDLFEISLGLESLGSIFPGDGKYNQLRTVMPVENVNRIIILALIVLFSACFNYTNLSLARSLKRAREVGIRKVVGASRFQLFGQFIFEAVLISLISLAVGYALFLVIKPEFLELDRYISRTTSLSLTPQIGLLFFGLAIAVGVLAGFLPSLIMTRFKPSSILKGIHKMRVGKGVGVREIMTGLQFAFSMGFAILVILSYKQYNFAMNFDLGFETSNILNVELHENDPDILKAAFEGIPEVQSASYSSFIASTGTTNSDDARLLGATDSINAYNLSIDPTYLETMGHELVAGSNFTSASSEEQIIVNEKFVTDFQLGSTSDAIGTRVHFYKKNRTIVGVVKNFHYGTIRNELDPFVFLAGKTNKPYFVNLKIQSSDMVRTMEKLDEAWSTVDQEHEFKAAFYTEQIAMAYSQLSSTLKTFGLLGIVAISISILGLLGMAVYTTESRIKELTIRKVLGATFSSMALLLSKNFIKIFIVASAVAIPMSYYLFKQTIVNTMEYAIEIGFWELASGSFLIILIALVTISSQTFKAAKTNPATNLRNE
ncbi:MAG: ABC transporter permease [Cyclobacteriaceae bacterium]